jgi:hypothetical protein
MMDSPAPTAKSLAPIAIAIALVASASPARAQDPTVPDAAAPAPSTETAPSPASEKPTATAAPAPAPAHPADEAPPGRAATASDTTAASNAPPVGGVPGPGARAGAEPTETSWYARAPLALTAGLGDKQWSLTFYGIIEADYIYDTTRSYDDRLGADLVARTDTYDGNHPRSQFSIRNSRLGLKLQAPLQEAVKASAVLEADFANPKPEVPSDTPEREYFDNPTFRLRHAYLLLEDDYVDVLAGQTYGIFGWWFSRSTQFRLSHNFGASTSPVTLGLAVAAVRPAQRDSGVPDGNAALRLNLNHWQGVITTPAVSGSTVQASFLQISGIGRQFKANAFAPPPTQASNSATGWGVSVDALLAVIPANGPNDRGNRLTLTGDFVTGTGIADLINVNGGAEFPVLSNPAQANPPPLYEADVDQGLVTFDTRGVLHTIDWREFRVGVQYYLPPSGRVFITANFIQGHSANMAKLFPKGGAEIELLGRVADTTYYGDTTLYWDATPSVRFGLQGAYTKVRYLDGDQPHNVRGMGLAQYAF